MTDSQCLYAKRRFMGGSQMNLTFKDDASLKRI